MKIIIEYDPVNKTLEIVENDFTTFEAMGILTAANSMIAENWHEKDRN
jgi:hypothetical protein